MFKRSSNNLLKIVSIEDDGTNSVGSTITLKEVDGYDTISYNDAIKYGLSTDSNQEANYICVYYLDGSTEFFKSDVFDVVEN